MSDIEDNELKEVDLNKPADTASRIRKIKGRWKVVLCRAIIGVFVFLLVFV